MHPDVKSGKKTEEQILLEFLETFETHHSLRNNGAPDHIVTKEEFEEYYNNISASVDDDKYFELMMNNAWKINEADRSLSTKSTRYCCWWKIRPSKFKTPNWLQQSLRSTKQQHLWNLSYSKATIQGRANSSLNVIL
jgi:hypothetical protein